MKTTHLILAALCGLCNFSCANGLTDSSNMNTPTAPPNTAQVTPQQYAQEIYRTKPDFILYRPSGERNADSENQEIIVTPLPSGDFLATWTMSTHENHPDQRVVVARSKDKGKTWSTPVVIDGATPEQQQKERGKYQASWSFFVHAPKLKRIYLFYNKNLGKTDARDDTTGVLRFRYSDDEGQSWSEPFDHLEIARGAIDHPDKTMPVNFVIWCQPFHDAAGIPMTSLTRWGSGSPELLSVDSEVWFLRFDNILEERDPLKLRMSTLPEGEHGLCVPSPFKKDISVAQEGATILLPDGRLFVAIRTLQGSPYWSQSKDSGATWSTPAPLLYRDGGERVLHPISPAPLWEYAPGRYFLLFHDNDGYAFGASGPTDYQKNRRPTKIVCARFSPDSAQPLVFGTPQVLLDTDGVILGPTRRVEPASYPSYFEDQGTHYLWYPDRKHFLLGKVLNSYLDFSP